MACNVRCMQRLSDKNQIETERSDKEITKRRHDDKVDMNAWLKKKYFENVKKNHM